MRDASSPMRAICAGSCSGCSSEATRVSEEEGAPGAAEPAAGEGPAAADAPAPSADRRPATACALVARAPDGGARDARAPGAAPRGVGPSRAPGPGGCVSVEVGDLVASLSRARAPGSVSVSIGRSMARASAGAATSFRSTRSSATHSARSTPASRMPRCSSPARFALDAAVFTSEVTNATKARAGAGRGRLRSVSVRLCSLSGRASALATSASTRRRASGERTHMASRKYDARSPPSQPPSRPTNAPSSFFSSRPEFPPGSETSASCE